MAPKSPSRHALQAAATLAVLSALAAGHAGAVEVACRVSDDYVVEVDGAYPQDARFYETDTHGTFLVDIPSLSLSALIDVPAGRAIQVPRTGLRREAIDGTIRVRPPRGSDAPAWRLGIEGPNVAFQADAAKVRLVRAAERAPAAGPAGTGPPPAGGAPARSCLSIESRPVFGVPGCTKWVYIRNTCKDRVAARIQRTEHLFSGTLPETVRVVAAPLSEQSLGCAWWNGSMAPTGYELVSAGFLDPPPAAGSRDGSGPPRQ